MAAQNGRDLLIKMDMTGDGAFETIAGLRASRLSFNAETVDVTSLESEGGWRELLGGAGVRSASISSLRGRISRPIWASTPSVCCAKPRPV